MICLQSYKQREHKFWWQPKIESDGRSNTVCYKLWCAEAYEQDYWIHFECLCAVVMVGSQWMYVRRRWIVNKKHFCAVNARAYFCLILTIIPFHPIKYPQTIIWMHTNFMVHIRNTLNKPNTTLLPYDETATVTTSHAHQQKQTAQKHINAELSASSHIWDSIWP